MKKRKYKLFVRKEHIPKNHVNICLIGIKGERQGHLDPDISHFGCRNDVNAVNAAFAKTGSEN